MVSNMTLLEATRLVTKKATSASRRTGGHMTTKRRAYFSQLLSSTMLHKVCAFASVCQANANKPVPLGYVMS